MLVVSQYLGSRIGSVNVIQKYPWCYKNSAGNWTTTNHTYNMYDYNYVFDATPVWAGQEISHGAPQEGTLTEREFFKHWKLRNAELTETGTDFTFHFAW